MTDVPEQTARQNVLQHIVNGNTDCAAVDLASQIYMFRAESGVWTVTETSPEQKVQAILDIADLCISEEKLLTVVGLIDEAVSCLKDNEAVKVAARLKSCLAQLDNEVEVIAQCEFEGANVYQNEIKGVLEQYPPSLRENIVFVAATYFRELHKTEIAELSALPDDGLLKQYARLHIEQNKQVVGIFDSMMKDSIDGYKEKTRIDATRAILYTPIPTTSKASILRQLYDYAGQIDTAPKSPAPTEKQKRPEL